MPSAIKRSDLYTPLQGDVHGCILEAIIYRANLVLHPPCCGTPAAIRDRCGKVAKLVLRAPVLSALLLAHGGCCRQIACSTNHRVSSTRCISNTDCCKPPKGVLFTTHSNVWLCTCCSWILHKVCACHLRTVQDSKPRSAIRCIPECTCQL